MWLRWSLGHGDILASSRFVTTFYLPHWSALSPSSAPTPALEFIFHSVKNTSESSGKATGVINRERSHDSRLEVCCIKNNDMAIEYQVGKVDVDIFILQWVIQNPYQNVFTYIKYQLRNHFMRFFFTRGCSIYKESTWTFFILKLYRIPAYIYFHIGYSIKY